MRAILLLLLRWLFRFRHFGAEHLATKGPVLLVPNHSSWIDWLFLGVLLEEDWKFVVSSTTAQQSWIHRAIMLNSRTFPVDISSPYAVKRIAEYLQTGGRLVLFAEGQISWTGSLMKLYDGTGFLLHKTKASVLTCYLRGAGRLRWSRQPGWRRWFPAVSAHFSAPQNAPEFPELSTSRARQRLTGWLRDRMVRQQFDVEQQFGPQGLLEAIVASAKEQPHHVILEDVTGQELTYRRLLVGALVLGEQMAGHLSASPLDAPVGVLLPNVNANPVVLMSLWALGRVPASLNFSTGAATMLACAKLAGLQVIITSRVFLSRVKLSPEPFEKEGLKMLYLEDLRAGIDGFAKLRGLARVWFRPECLLSALGRDTSNPGARPAVILFTSGSEGVPKGVVLSHANVLANIRQLLSITDLEDKDRIFNALPLFHSFGLAVGTLLGLVRGLFVFLYPSPLHYRLVPAIVYDRNCTIMLGTNTFLNGYARKAHTYDFRSVRYLFAAAEKLQESTANTYARKFGVRVLEGYGATECSPCISLNTPMQNLYGSAGRIVPGMSWKLEPVEGVERGGRLLVRGPNVMHGYVNPDANAKFQSLGGWYDTGDIVELDEDGFVFIRGRLKRFAKVSGEMVSLAAVEEAFDGAFPQYGLRCHVAVVTRPDEDKGEALVAVSNEPRLKIEDLRAAIKARGLSNLCVPKELVFVREIPKLGTGKVNHRELTRILGESQGSA